MFSTEIRRLQPRYNELRAESAVLPEWQPDSVEAQSLLAVDNGGEVSDLAEVPGVGIVGVQPINHGGPNLKAKPVETLHPP